ncbi:MAG: lipopolysaccharide biosynthesis protein [Burkholderiales bacterium]|nr:lipopolysaccharide biosynthesis protein [Burkholderiales bacterium]
MTINTTTADSDQNVILVPLLHWKKVILGSILVTAVAIACTFIVAPTYTARASFLPPQSQSSASTAIASLSALSSLAGGIANIKTPADQFVALMQSVTISDRIIDSFKLREVYGKDYLSDTRKLLTKNVRVAAGKKDGIISLEVDDETPERAAAMANAYITELKSFTATLAITEAQQRRVFFEEKLTSIKESLKDAQSKLQATGFDIKALRAEPKAAAEAYARLKAEVTASSVRLQTLRSTLTNSAPEIKQAEAALGALQQQLAGAESPSTPGESANYVSAYRDYKYQEALFELISRQYEVARLDESREGALIQVIDAAAPPDKRSSPKRSIVAAVAMVTALIGLSAFFVARHLWRKKLRAQLKSQWLALQTIEQA